MSTSSGAAWQRLVSTTKAQLERDGLAVVSAFDRDLKALYSYTVGLSREEHDNHPELVVVGLRPNLARPVLQAAAAHALVPRDGLRAGSLVHGVLSGVSLTAVDVLDTGSLLPVANTLLGEPGIPVAALQLVYPDATGRMPWEPGADPRIPLLGFEPPSIAERERIEPEHTDGYGYGL